MLNNIKKYRGFTLLEVLVAIFLLTLGIGGSFALVSQAAVSSQLTVARLEAAYLAQEGIELIRNTRDANFLKIYKGAGTDWLEGLADSETEIDLGASFKRKIIISTESPDEIGVRAEVSWQERGRTHKITVQEFLYKWWK